jgi:hypothetical protein
VCIGVVLLRVGAACFRYWQAGRRAGGRPGRQLAGWLSSTHSPTHTSRHTGIEPIHPPATILAGQVLWSMSDTCTSEAPLMT